MSVSDQPLASRPPWTSSFPVTMSEDLQEDLIELGLQRYVSVLLDAGYDDWDAVGGMTESDFDALNIRLGDRRKLQREIARRQLWPENSPLPTPDELREFTLSLRDGDAEEVKNGYFLHRHVSEALDLEVISPDIEAAARDTSPFNVQDEGSGGAGETPESPDSIPILELDEINDAAYNFEGSAFNHLSVVDPDFDEDDTPRPPENRTTQLE